ncbi:Endonuclease/exonuclease/phosphatase [Pelagophyceae sp. CCMP2097]|nr:Endonuclease/exonuclease/phosphatase [Pelagophyceae sp. CCMP2097]
MVAVIRAPAALPSCVGALSLLSFNVLLPNGADGWWLYKQYPPGLESRASAAWPARQSLIRAAIAEANADVVLLQEVSPETFPDDFAFMADLGYEALMYSKKGRFRPATFWKSTKCTLLAEAHRDRCLLTTFETAPCENRKVICVVNAHLQAGPEGGRRLRQTVEALDHATKSLKKLGVPPRIVFAGDLNGGDDSAAVRLLEDGFVKSGFVEDGEVCTLKDKNNAAGIFLDASAAASERPPPPTLVVPELYASISKGESTGTRQDDLSDDAVSAFREAFFERASGVFEGGKVMTKGDVEAWLVDINGHVGRGSEFRAALEFMAPTPPTPPPPSAVDAAPDALEEPAPLRREFPADSLPLSVDSFVEIYRQELRQGKVWGVAHDLGALGKWPLPQTRKGALFTARFDRIYCSEHLRVVSVRDSTSDVPCPNANHASDHLPVGAVLQFSDGA